ncbi:hypothetical protein [Psychroflexus montanilacus]|uniref:hypothetical protein n=1 Tax=Psychroflexus montanilacus TaxID=2873598 RepID=UPI001CCB22DC|nr:hypothetical protein [Psychroflexus montanilacus]MBZ9651185.1 hypothetical protein [Psychroflexus montanilacus]
MIIIIAIASLILINFLLLKFSCDCGDKQPKVSKKKFKVNTPKIWSQSQQETNSNPVLADK